MVCDELESLIPVFLEDKLAVRQLDEFLGHVEDCEECRSELELNYIIKYGFSDEYSVDDYDFIKMIDTELNEKKKLVKNIKRRHLFRIITWISTNFIILMCSIYMFFIAT